jgi:catechol 2,3-dioxygenase-like lactoylglutathione lyase family enzyme
MSIETSHLDHLVMTVADIEKTCDFYKKVMGMKVITFKGTRKALHFGQQKINLHQAGKEFEPKALVPMPGSLDLCFIVSTPIDKVINHLGLLNIVVEEGPIERTGSQGPIMSVYIRDLDGNLIELSNQLK